MKQKQPFISIIIAVLNAEKTLRQSIGSISKQTYSNWELIVIDGGSTDGTINILNNNSKSIAYWESKPDKGIYHPWNKALSHANGDWIYFLGDDDFLCENDVLDRI